jgi:hypothetical protein
MYQKCNICNSAQILLLLGNGLWFMYQKDNICNSAQILLLLGNGLFSCIKNTIFVRVRKSCSFQEMDSFHVSTIRYL